MGEYLDLNNRCCLRRWTMNVSRDDSLEAGELYWGSSPAVLARPGSLHCLLQDCYGTLLSNTSPQRQPYLKNKLFARKSTIKTNKKKIMLTWWGLLNYTYYLFISRIQVAHLTDVLQGCLNTSAPCLLQCSDSHLLYNANKNWITLWQNPSTAMQASALTLIGTF